MDQPQLERRPRNRTVVSSDQVEKAQEELLCSICIDFFKQPRSLPCQHSFCHDCLVPLASRPTSGSKTSASKGVVISCPECRANTCLPENGVRGKLYYSDSLGDSVRSTNLSVCMKRIILNFCFWGGSKVVLYLYAIFYDQSLFRVCVPNETNCFRH